MDIYVNEIFVSIQGEGAWTGTPMVFVRLQGCNLRCPWCDTQEAQALQGVRPMPVEELAQQLSGQRPNRILITGGEPLLQGEAVAELLRLLQPPKRLHLETNGTQPFPDGQFFYWITVSPKPPHYVIHRSLEPDEIKIVVSDTGQLRLAEDLAKEYPRSTISLQPESNKPELIRECIKYLEGRRMSERSCDWRLSLQVHKLIDIR